MKILVTGGAGYIGSVLVPMLLEENHEIFVLDNFLYNQVSLLSCCANSKFNITNGDVRDERTMWRHVVEEKPDFIIPLACFTGAPICDRWPEEAKDVIVNSLRILFDLVNQNQKIIYPTTNSGYGIGENGIYCTENTPLRPVSLYGKLKVEAEKMIMKEGNAVSLRLATAFGASPRMRLDLLVNDFVFKAVSVGLIKVFEGHFKRNYIHVQDIARAFIHCINNWETVKNNTYNVGLSDANLSKLELCEKIKRHFPKLQVVEGEGKDPDQRNYIVSNEKIERTGFFAKFSLDEGIGELVKCFEIVKTKKHETFFSNS